MTNTIKHLATITSGGMICYGVYTAITCNINYWALPLTIIGLVWYAANQSDLA
jgi:hypothetical protein